MAHTYCMNESEWIKAIAPVKPSTFIGPPKDCNKENANISYKDPHYTNQYPDRICPYTHQQ